jgi:hypothetical protein
VNEEALAHWGGGGMSRKKKTIQIVFTKQPNRYTKIAINHLTPESNPSVQRCLTRVMAVVRPYGEFYDFYGVSPEYFGYNHVKSFLSDMNDT